MNWDDFTGRLTGELTRLPDDAFLIVQQPGGLPYVQTLRCPGRLDAEAVGSAFLPWPLGPEQEKMMTSLGWRPPDRRTQGNWWRRAKAQDTEYGALAEGIVAAFRDVYGVRSPRELVYLANQNGADGGFLRLPGLGIPEAGAGAAIGWPDFSEQLACELYGLDPDMVLVVAQLAQGSHYVQAFRAPDELRAEAVSGHALPPELSFDPAAEDRLESVGWRPPGAQLNWAYEIPADAAPADYRRLAAMMVTALTEVQGARTPADLTYEAFRGTAFIELADFDISPADPGRINERRARRPLPGTPPRPGRDSAPPDSVRNGLTDRTERRRPPAPPGPGDQPPAHEPPAHEAPTAPADEPPTRLDLPPATRPPTVGTPANPAAQTAQNGTPTSPATGSPDRVARPTPPVQPPAHRAAAAPSTSRPPTTPATEPPAYGAPPATTAHPPELGAHTRPSELGTHTRPSERGAHTRPSELGPHARSSELGARTRPSGSAAAPSGSAAAPSGSAAAPSGPAVTPSGPAAAPSGPVVAPSGHAATGTPIVRPVAGRQPRAAEPASRVQEPGSGFAELELEGALLGAKERGDQQAYLRLLLSNDLVLPAPADVESGRYATGVFDDGTYVLAFTSAEALDGALRDPAVRHRRTSFAELARQWPRPDWQLAVNPWLPSAAYIDIGTIERIARQEEDRPLPRPVPAEGTIMQKAVPPEHVPHYLEGGYHLVAGHVHRLHDVVAQRTPRDLIEALGLAHEGSPFTSGELHVIRWPVVRGALYRPSYGWGNVPDFMTDSQVLPHGAEMFRIDRSGDETLVAVYSADTRAWVRKGPDRRAR